VQTYFEGLADSTGRQHPWLHSTINPDWKYYDFKKNPELVSEVLEDFKPWAHYDSVQLFYEMLRWVNGPESKFETSDCGFRGPSENQQKDGWPKEMVCSGGLFVFFRNLQYNLSDESKSWKENHPGGGSLAKPYAQSKYTQWLINQSQQLIRQSKHDWACIGLGLISIMFTEAPVPENEQLGYAVVYRFWAWGDSEKETMTSFNYVVDTLFTIFKRLSAQAT
jgi:hypothetical protein